MTRAALILFTLAAVCLSACTSSQAPSPAGKGDAAIRGTVSGLETQTWIVDDTTGAVARALAEYADRPVPARADHLLVWRAGGLRIIAVPAADLGKLRASLALIGPQQQRWNGELPRWTSILAGPSWKADRELSVATGPELHGREPIPLTAGRLRLLARAYALPVVDADALAARLTIELVPQHEEPEGSARALTRQLRGATDAEELGMIFRQLTLEFVAAPDECYIITAEAPELEWITGAERSNDAPGPELARQAAPPAPPTLGEAMLTDINDEGELHARVLLVLVPKVASTYSLTDR